MLPAFVPAQASAGIVFSPSDAACQRAFLWRAHPLHGASKTQTAFAEDALVRICVREAFHQHRKPGPLRFFPYRHSASQTFGSSVPRLRLARKPE
ncbi:hypothetical protein ETR_07541 [Erwinia tracheiphila PSU-1]|nr:hypothetical protein ETR_07541 [Erwinia tracheiphila PSU-1]